MKRKWLLFFLTLCIAMTSVFGGCNGFYILEKTPDLNYRTPTPMNMAQTIFVWWSQDEDDLILLNDAWYDFRDLYVFGDNAKYSEKINMFSMDGDPNGTTQLEQQYMAGTAPDLLRMDHVYLTYLGEKGLVVDLQERFGVNQQLANQFIPSTWDASCSGNAVYGIPFDANTFVFGGKSAVLEQAGVGLPTTYNELRSTGAKIKALNPEESVYTLPVAGYSTMSPVTALFMTWLWRMGGDLLNEDNTEAIFNDPETGVAALNMMLQLQEDGLAPREGYEVEKSVLGDYGTWWMQGFTEEMEFALQPQLKEGVPQYSALGLYDLAVVSSASEVEMTYDFAVHLATGKSNASGKHYAYTYCRNHSFIPALEAAATTGGIWNTSDTEGEFWRMSVEQLRLSKSRPTVPCWPDIETALATAVIMVMNGEAVPKEALDAAAATANRLLDQWHGTESETAA